MNRHTLILITILALQLKCYSQDARLTDYSQVPLLMNPSNTGDFSGDIRTMSSYNLVHDAELKNTFFNLAADYNLPKYRLAVGINYLKTGSSQFAASGNYFGISLSNHYYIGPSKIHKLKAGVQLCLLSSTYDTGKKGYNPYMDVRAFDLKNLSRSPGLDKYNQEFINMNIGIGYEYYFDKLRVSFDGALYNIINSFLRYRMNTTFEFSYAINPENAIKLSQLNWQEGYFLPKSKNLNVSDSIRIKEVVYKLEWQRIKQKFSSVSLQTRSMRTIAAVVGFNIIPSLTTKISYELSYPNENEMSYWNLAQFGAPVSQFGVSAAYLFKKKKFSPRR